MLYYITFDVYQEHTINNVVFNKHNAAIINQPTLTSAREIAKVYFGEEYHAIYNEPIFNALDISKIMQATHIRTPINNTKETIIAKWRKDGNNNIKLININNVCYANVWGAQNCQDYNASVPFIKYVTIHQSITDAKRWAESHYNINEPSKATKPHYPPLYILTGVLAFILFIYLLLQVIQT